MLILFWIVLCIVAGFLGKDRKIGSAGAFFLSLILSPLIGLIVTLASERLSKEEIAEEKLIGEKDSYQIVLEATKDDPNDKPKLSPQARKLMQEGQINIRNKNYDVAIEKYESVLSLMPIAPNSNFQLATLYSAKNQKDKSYKHLTHAIEQGFDDFSAINSNSLLEFLRKQPDFKDFVQNGYKLPESASSTEDNLLNKLEKLGELHSKGILTNEEFVEQKSLLLNKQKI